MVDAVVKKTGLRLLTIDLLRGVAALAVMLFHALKSGMFVHSGEVQVPTSIAQIGIYPVSYGFTGVYLFFVISGFCIHMRWVKNKSQGGADKALEFVAFWKRRFRRIYPAYIVALILFIAAQRYLGNINFNGFFAWDLSSHLLMLHNLDARTVYSMNGVFWTLAIEEQLYLAYFLLVWIRKRYDWGITIIFTLGARIAWFLIALVIIRFMRIEVPILESSMANWFIWTLGAVSVEAAYGIIKLPKWCYSTLLCALILLSTSLIYFYDWTNAGAGIAGKIIMFAIQPLWGLGYFILVNKIVSLEGEFSNVWARAVRCLAWVGLFSYSLYLIHELVFIFIPDVNWSLKGLLAVIVAWIFYLCLEKPFMNVQRVKTMSETVA